MLPLSHYQNVINYLQDQLAALERDHAAHLAAAVAEAVLQERQACVEAVDQALRDSGITFSAATVERILAAIRARGKGE